MIFAVYHIEPQIVEHLVAVYPFQGKFGETVRGTAQQYALRIVVLLVLWIVVLYTLRVVVLLVDCGFKFRFVVAAQAVKQFVRAFCDFVEDVHCEHHIVLVGVGGVFGHPDAVARIDFAKPHFVVFVLVDALVKLGAYLAEKLRGVAFLNEHAGQIHHRHLRHCEFPIVFVIETMRIVEVGHLNEDWSAFLVCFVSLFLCNLVVLDKTEVVAAFVVSRELETLFDYGARLFEDAVECECNRLTVSFYWRGLRIREFFGVGCVVAVKIQHF